MAKNEGIFSKKCTINPTVDCICLKKAEELEKELDDLRKQDSVNYEHLSSRLNDLERHKDVQEEQFKHIIEKLTDLSASMNDIKKDSKEIITQIPSLVLRIDTLEKTAADVDELKEAPGKKWESASSQIIGILIAAVAGFLLSRLGM